MGSYKPRVFDPLDLEIIDRIYEVAWAQLEASDPFRDRERDGSRGEALRKLIFALADYGKVDFDTLCDRVLTNMPDVWNLSPEVGSRVSDRGHTGRKM